MTALLGGSVLAMQLPLGRVAVRAAAARTQPWAADAFVDSVGLNVHLGSPPYRDHRGAVAHRLAELGVRHLRDELRPSNDLQTWQSLHERCGIRSHLLVSPETNTVAEMLDYLGALGAAKVSAIEGQNEGDSPWFTAQPSARRGWAAAVLAYQREAYKALRTRYPGSALPMLSPTVLDYKPDDVKLIAPAAAFCDIVAVHPYAQGMQEPETAADYAGLDWYRHAFCDRFKPGAPVMATEAGYHNGAGGISPTAAAKYLPRLLLHAFDDGVARTFLYELMDGGADRDDPEQNFGLVSSRGEPKPAFLALRRLLAALADPGPEFAPASVELVLRRGAPDLRSIVFQKRSGEVIIAAWRSTRSWDAELRRDIFVPRAQLEVVCSKTVRRGEVLRIDESDQFSTLSQPGMAITLPIADSICIIRLNF